MLRGGTLSSGVENEVTFGEVEFEESFNAFASDLRSKLSWQRKCFF